MAPQKFSVNKLTTMCTPSMDLDTMQKCNLCGNYQKVRVMACKYNDKYYCEKCFFSTEKSGKQNN